MLYAERPGDPEIEILTPADIGDAYLADSTVSLVCRSRDPSPDTRLVWYQGASPIDQTYSIQGEYVVNEINVTLPARHELGLTCRFDYDPTGYTASANTIIPIIGNHSAQHLTNF